jgi:hypothetical protein
MQFVCLTEQILKWQIDLGPISLRFIMTRFALNLDFDVLLFHYSCQIFSSIPVLNLSTFNCYSFRISTFRHCNVNKYWSGILCHHCVFHCLLPIKSAEVIVFCNIMDNSSFNLSSASVSTVCYQSLEILFFSTVFSKRFSRVSYSTGLVLLFLLL